MDSHPDFEVWFVADDAWEAKLKAIDSRFKFAIVKLENDYNLKMAGIVQKLEAVLNMDNAVDKLVATWRMFTEDHTLYEVRSSRKRGFVFEALD